MPPAVPVDAVNQFNPPMNEPPMDQETTVVESPPSLNEAVPDFSAAMTGNKTFKLSDYKGKNIVLYFYPKDNTPGCTAEGLRFRDLFPQFQQANAEIFGVSRDSIRSHEGFKAKLEMPFELISDPDETVCNMFDVMKMKNMYGKLTRGVDRCTFAIDGSGRLVKEWRRVKVPGHVDEVLEFMKAIA
jgi:peroxiredoxin Q/BCP